MVAVCSVNGTDLNRWLVAEGHALAYRRYSTDYEADEELRRIDWLPSLPPKVGAPELGERLATASRPWIVALQHWPAQCAESRRGRLAPIESEAGLAAVEMTFAAIAADAPDHPRKAADVVVSWECP